MADFREEQKIDMWWARLIVIAGAVLTWAIALTPSLYDSRCVDAELRWVAWFLVAMLGVLVPWLIFSLKMTVTIDANGVHIRYRPFVNRHISFDDIESFRARRYRPILEYGGWGIRVGFGNKGAYNTRGNEGVELFLRGGHALMLGSQRAEALAKALRGRGVTEAAGDAP